MSDRFWQWSALAAIIGTGVLHLIEAQHAFGAATYAGLLFVASGIGGLVAAFGIQADDWNWGWLLGALVAGCTALAYVASRTVGLPGIPAAPRAWLMPTGVASLVCEGAFLLLFVRAWRLRSVR